MDYNSLSDDQLIEYLSLGNVMAYTEVYNRYFDVLYMHTRHKLTEPDDAKDVIQEAFTQLWNKRDGLMAINNLKAYLYVSVRNGILNTIARKKHEQKYKKTLPPFISNVHAITDHRIREKQLISLIDEQIAQLPEKMRILFEMSRKQTLSHKEIGIQMNISELTVKKQVANAVKILRKKLGESFVLIVL
ncbi:RNA polymerase sigma-70 factor [Pedobacter nyackensis]|uniref:RNA polymerase sigma factor n=1 Tax=Pedobacter nyackensis TaxID=475255 RepID=UPI00292D02FB|nr:RNA polymerase sigma-70 factor [Pedobacter nyackensis]